MSLDTKSEMVGADAVVAFFDRKTGRGHVIDYNLESKQQCVGSYGSCPDIKSNFFYINNYY